MARARCLACDSIYNAPISKLEPAQSADRWSGSTRCRSKNDAHAVAVPGLNKRATNPVEPSALVR